MAECKKCGFDNWLIIERVGALETWRCESCGEKEVVHVFDPASEPSLPENLAPVFRIVGRWTLRPSAQQIDEIRASFPNLRNVSVATLLRKAAAQSDVDLGRFTEAEMRNLLPMLQRVGMEIVKTPIKLESGGA